MIGRNSNGATGFGDIGFRVPKPVEFLTTILGYGPVGLGFAGTIDIRLSRILAANDQPPGKKQDHPPGQSGRNPRPTPRPKALSDQVPLTLLSGITMLIPIIRSPRPSTSPTHSPAPEIVGQPGENSTGLVTPLPEPPEGNPDEAEADESLMILVPDIDLAGLRIVARASRTVASGQIERMRLILGILLRFSASYRDDAEECHLNAKKLGKLINNRNVRPLLQALRKAGYIRCDGLYIPGEKSYGYRLTKAALRHRLVFARLSGPMSRRIKMYNPNHRDAPMEAAAHEFIRRSLHELTVVDSVWNLLLHEKIRLSAAELQRAWSLRVIESGQTQISVSDRTGRLFSTFTSVASDMRPYLRLRGQHCAEVDVGACQPLLLSTLYPAESEEKTRYLDLVTSGRFYETLQGDCQQNHKTRSNFKVSLMVEVLFGERDSRGPIWKAFATRFPQLAQLRKDFGTSSQLALHLQKMEASIVIEKVVPRLAEELDGRPVLTLHDAIFCIDRDATFVAAVMLEEFERFLGITPVVKINVFKDNDAR